MTENVKISDMVHDNGLKVYAGADYLKNKSVGVTDISRPGLELTGYFDFYPHERIQLLGMTEVSYANELTQEERLSVFDRMCKEEDTPCFLISRGLAAPDELLEKATEYKIPVLSSQLSTTRLSSVITEYLEYRLAERRSIHGVLVDIYGLGVLIMGSSGVGKSETALELVKRGHRLIADDRVDVFQQDEKTVVGEAPAILKHLLEIRGIGIIDVMNLFGAGAVRASTPISLVVNLENWDNDKNYDRVGFETESMPIFDVNIPKITVPVKVGRNLAIIIEVAAMNFRAKNMGYDATKKFEENLANLIQDNTEKEQ
ncbi:HPr(Ser) kinase phosphatase [Amylolactobacillus amylotrophicus DSM 20534]|uniref:HPr kinase/phosphorylase n=3 Tax=Amylolactobacillus TaxID=2767876 RepID=A0A0R1YRQ4_9LACO|nr:MULTISPECIES: HPr(Ser) kinase/phosphatase [Amylolactobacillus]APT18953.1 HPr kinase/phosphorylase [Amylolactobacillus amylophilus DSM 20533 = JCM 1125]KRK38788.1 HPr(Ser) kinase phosphatase [Amylolactobacillus amylotrophicus DSM 20534]KRM42569.1 HPr(Ser) kinase phosphatase [Amylolactobacillus amylophilus DSM 20533 = JCM 1125]GED80009.1 HPr kinase/phosphorylase [Amylolactobacillus amylophilus]